MKTCTQSDYLRAVTQGPVTETLEVETYDLSVTLSLDKDRNLIAVAAYGAATDDTLRWADLTRINS